MDEQSYGTGILSRYDIKSVTTCDLPGQYYAEDRVLTRISVWIDHREVAPYNVHLAYESDALRAEQMACIAEIFASDPLSYKVLGGDFNVRSFDEYAPFSDFLMVSNEETPFETYQKEDWDIRCLDNIIYTDTLQLVDAQMVESSLSDHYLLSASFLFADETEDF